MKSQVVWISAALVLLLCSVTFAHTGQTGGPAGGAAAGFAHPFTGWDHLSAIIMVGAWAGQLGGRARWLVPASFVAAMIVGGALAAAGVPARLAEQGVLASVVALGLLVTRAARMPNPAAAVIVGLFAIFHGHAHVAEMPAGDSLAHYAAGFVLATALLHLGGLAMASAMRQADAPVATRICGGAVALAAIVVWIGAR